MAQDRKKLRAVVNALMNSGFYKVWRISWAAEEVLVSQERLRCMKLVCYECFGRILHHNGLQTPSVLSACLTLQTAGAVSAPFSVSSEPSVAQREHFP
jgi:hypothetical protein